MISGDELARPVNGHPAPQALKLSSMKEPPAPGAQAAAYPAHGAKESLEVTVLKELGGDWEVYELPATTKSVRNSRGAARSVWSLKGGNTMR